MRYILLICFSTLFSIPAFSFDYLGTEATFGWTEPTSGTPEGYVVWVSRNGANPTEEQTVALNEATISGTADETIVVSVQAYTGEYRSGMSEASDPVTFKVMTAPTGIQIKCPDGQTFQEIGGGWWSCK